MSGGRIDLARARRDLAYFAGAVGSPLTGWQADALRLESRISVIVAPRQSGKSRALAVQGLWWALTRPGATVLLISAGEDASRRLLADVRGLVSGSAFLRASAVDEQAGLLTLTNGSSIRSVPASERQIRGWRVDLLLVDEAALVADDLLLGAAFPTTAARPDARIVMASSANVASGAFYDHAIRGEQGSQHVRTFRWRLADATWIAASTIAAARESMSPLRFSAEYEGEFASGAGALFDRYVLDRALIDWPLARLADLQPRARLAVGHDWAGPGQDRNATVALGRIPGESVFAVVGLERWPAGTPMLDVVAALAGTPAHVALLTAERVGLGESACELLVKEWRKRPEEAGGGVPGHVLVDAHRWNAWLDERRRGTRRGLRLPWEKPPPFVTRKNLHYTSSASKATMFSTLRLLMDRGALRIPRSADELVRELLMLRVDLTAAGNERIAAAGAGHDDLAMALGLALGPYRDGDRWRTVVGDLADRPSPLPAADTSGDTGAYQSVAGREVTTTRSARSASSLVRMGDFHLDLNAAGRRT